MPFVEGSWGASPKAQSSTGLVQKTDDQQMLKHNSCARAHLPIPCQLSPAHDESTPQPQQKGPLSPVGQQLPARPQSPSPNPQRLSPASLSRLMAA
jgi:hypothetical protein